ncbi:unnamed protein product [Prunus brigantina]
MLSIYMIYMPATIPHGTAGTHHSSFQEEDLQTKASLATCLAITRKRRRKKGCGFLRARGWACFPVAHWPYGVCQLHHFHVTPPP